jgi:hypothetical protein
VKKLVYKIAALLAPYIVFALAVICYVENSVALHEGVFNRVLEEKIRVLVKPDTEIIIAGDSRAERQIVPAIVTSRTGRNAANIATTSCDLISLYNALKEHKLLAERNALIVSTSIFQINDGAVDTGYLSTACLLNMSLLEKLSVYRDDLGELLIRLIKASFQEKVESRYSIADGIIAEKGFNGIKGEIHLPFKILLDPEKTNHSWYKKLSLHGVRWRIFSQTLEKMAASPTRIYIYLPPISPAWRIYSADTFIDRGEREFGDMLSKAIKRYPNIRFLDFYTDPDSRLGNEMYYDGYHLNRTGAALFTEILMEKIGADLRAEKI